MDRFADVYNCQVERFNSWYWNPGTEALHATGMGRITGGVPRRTLFPVCSNMPK